MWGWWIGEDPTEDRGIQGESADRTGPSWPGDARWRSYWSLNIAMAVPPAVTLTERDLVAPVAGLQLTE